jgi:AcrR family transcriptional regulator
VNNVNIPRTRSYHHGNLRAALLEATLRAIAEDGPEGFTLRDVARRAGVSAAAPYRHFKDKEELLAAVAGECAERLGELTERAVAAAAPNPLAQYRAAGIAYVQFVVAHPEHFRALNTPGIVARMPEEARRRWQQKEQENRQGLAAAQAAGAIAALPLDDVCLAAQALMHGLGHLIVEGQLGTVTPERATELAVAVTAVIGRGLAPRPPALPCEPAPSERAATPTAQRTRRPPRRS